MARGWEGQDSRVAMKLQVERANVKIAVDPKRIEEVLERDPLAPGDPRKK
jgi:hypothetical protein